MKFYVVVHLPILNVAGMAIFPFILIKEKHFAQDKYLINHELIHLRQQLELFVFPFYVLYVGLFLYHWWRLGNTYKAYRYICFEQEAYTHERDLGYLQRRTWWAFRRYW